MQILSLQKPDSWPVATDLQIFGGKFLDSNITDTRWLAFYAHQRLHINMCLTATHQCLHHFLRTCTCFAVTCVCSMCANACSMHRISLPRIITLGGRLANALSINLCTCLVALLRCFGAHSEHRHLRRAMPAKPRWPGKQQTWLDSLSPLSSSFAERFQVTVWLGHPMLLGAPSFLI